MASKERSSGTGAFAKGGGSAVVPQQGAHTASPGVTKTSGAGKTPFGVKGGTTKMFTESEAGTQKPGQTAPGGHNSPEQQFASGGSTKMFGKSGAMPVKPGVTSR